MILVGRLSRRNRANPSHRPAVLASILTAIYLHPGNVDDAPSCAHLDHFRGKKIDIPPNDCPNGPMIKNLAASRFHYGKGRDELPHLFHPV